LHTALLLVDALSDFGHENGDRLAAAFRDTTGALER